ncbi:MAG: hypothetical protein F9K23_11695 [Bacteroidetes bacterium]|nr:MAG: hypothetical protein F9K23_11695 [Bacteroidota bacterium]
MNLRNNIFVEVMHAHFNHYLQYYRHEPLNRVYNNPAQSPPTHGYPDDFFSIFEMITDPNEEKRNAVNEQLEQSLEDNADQFPQLDNVAKPQVKYNSILGVRMNLKQIKVGHPDTRVTTVTYRYKFYKLHYVLLFLLSRDKMKRAHIYNNHLKVVQREIYPEILPTAKKTTVTEGENEISELGLMKITEDLTPEFTVRRQCILGLSIIKAMGVNLASINFTDVAKFIHVLAAKEIPLDKHGKPIIDNSYIYKILKNLRRTPKETAAEDLVFIKKYVEPLDIENKNPNVKRLVKQLEIKSN